MVQWFVLSLTRMLVLSCYLFSRVSAGLAIPAPVMHHEEVACASRLLHVNFPYPTSVLDVDTTTLVFYFFLKASVSCA